MRGKPEKFAEHYAQATLFYDSQQPWEQAHIAAGFRFELSKVTVPAIRKRMVSGLVNVSPKLAQAVAEGLSIPVPQAMPRATGAAVRSEVQTSPALSLAGHPGDGSIRTRKVALLVAEGVDGEAVATLQKALLDAGAVARVVAKSVGPVRTANGDALQADASMECEPGFLFDALVLPRGDAAVAALSKIGMTMEFIRDQYRHGKTIWAAGDSRRLLEAAGIPIALPQGGDDPGLIVTDEIAPSAIQRFMAALAKHRHPQRETDPPRI